MTAQTETVVFDSHEAEPRNAGDTCTVAQPSLPVMAHVLTGPDALLSLRGDWESLHGTGGAFSRYEWFDAYARTLVAAPERTAFVHCADARGVLAIIPAVQSDESLLPFGRTRALTLAAHSHLGVMDFPMASRANPLAIGTAVIGVLARSNLPWRVIRWKRSPVGGNAWRVATALAHRSFVRCASPSNGFDTTLAFDTIQHGWSKNLRASLRKSRKRISDVNSWSVTSSTCRGEMERFFEEFLRLEASGWKGPAGTSSAIVLDERLRAFYPALLRSSTAGFLCEITLLKAAGRTISAHFAIVCERRKHILKIAYDEAAGKLSPGHLLLEEALKRACADASIDHVSLGTDMQWHRTWRPRPAENFEALMFRNPAASVAYRCYLTTLPLLRVLRVLRVLRERSKRV